MTFPSIFLAAQIWVQAQELSAGSLSLLFSQYSHHHPADAQAVWKRKAPETNEEWKRAKCGRWGEEPDWDKEPEEEDWHGRLMEGEEMETGTGSWGRPGPLGQGD